MGIKYLITSIHENSQLPILTRKNRIKIPLPLDLGNLHIVDLIGTIVEILADDAESSLTLVAVQDVLSGRPNVRVFHEQRLDGLGMGGIVREELFAFP